MKAPFRTFVLPFLLGSILAPGIAMAHPHVWVSVQSEIVMGGKSVNAVNHIWTFDEAFSAFAVQGLDEDGDGVYSRAELQPLAQVNVESLSEFDFFTDLYEKGAPDSDEAIFAEPVDYWLTYDKGLLTLHFTLPVLEAAKAKVNAQKEVILDVYDPTFFVDFSFSDTSPIKLANAPGSCSVSVKKAEALDDDTMGLLAQIPADQRELPPDLMQMTSTMANQVFLTCK
ncbi:ABC-type uncharacterized transport system, substrate-binding protein [Cohaesibacter sp. ES.047]|uniref:DUF1007 family protein n=1 Tax=Cohaesibacter sp. ES.047 TaxID=1798205 RepID=UPI000BB7559C|nr:DUF1007 family protein [Cohaesibacter sp. ES.047]SNY90915.1 ABC-type uncharacterized transport system, substrate-binding protein [Cohaesibacter sp. ES.047]